MPNVGDDSDFARDPEIAAWLNMVPVGREFGSPEFFSTDGPKNEIDN